MPHRSWQTLLLRAGGTLCLWLALTGGGPGAAPTTQAAPAGIITVTSLADSSGGPRCTLRDAVTAANTDSPAGGCPAGQSGTDTITFNLHPSCGIVICVIDVSSPLPTVTDDLTISGAGGTIILSGGGATRLFNVALEASLHLQHLTLENANSGANDGGAIVNHGNLWLEGSTIQNSHTDVSHSGGAIFTNRPVTLTDSLLQYNTGGSGGALFANFGQAVVTISNTTFLQNQAVNTTTAGYGGAIWIGSLAQVTIMGGTILSNTANDGGGIYLSPGAAVTLTAGGPPATVSGNRVNSFGGGIDNEQGRATLTNVAFSGNSGPAGGGGINNAGALMVMNSTFSGNVTSLGGAIQNISSGSATVADSRLSENSSSIVGGGIYNFGTLTVTSVTFSANSAVGNGGGLANNTGRAALVNVTFSGNSALVGGGLDNLISGTVALTNVTFSGNSAEDGGGIEIQQGTLTLANSTLFSNTALFGGGLGNVHGAATLANVTLAGNSASSGAELYDIGLQATQTITLLNTIVGPSASGANCFVDAASVASPTSGGYNLSSDGTCTAYFNQPGDMNNANPNLGPLANNGGPTLTQMPTPPSPAIDAIPFGVNGCGATLTTDQRGAPRPIHLKCDIGAVEYGWLYQYLWLPLVRR